MKTKSILLLLMIVFSQQIFSQGVTDARSAAMGKTSVTTSNGLYSLGSNPANLFQSGSSKIVELMIPLPLPVVSARIGSNFFTLDEYDYFFGQKFKDENGKEVGRYLTESDKSRLKNLFADGGSVFGDVNYTLFAVAVTPSQKFGPIAFSISDVISANATFPKDIVNLGMDGNIVNQVYNFNDSKMNAWWLRKYGFSYARNLNIIPAFKEFSFGVSFNVVQGFAYVGLDHIKTELTTDENNVITGRGEFLAYSSFSEDFHVKYDFDSLSTKQDANVSPFPKSAGSGLGIDFGFNAKLNDVWSFGFAMVDIGKITWNKNVAEFKSDRPIYLDDLTNENQRDSLVDALTGKGSGKYISEYSTDLATAMYIGASMQVDKMFSKFPGRMVVAFAFNKGFNDQPRNSTKSRFSIGADWAPFGALAFRTGFSFGGVDKFGWGLGLGFNFGLLELNFGTPDMQYVLSSSSAKRITVAFDSRWRF